ncbi:cold shock domain-containing E1-like [Brachionus plicatilis]|uniref:Cold shock domain-containing E1-like n=1 Tax=Brachionus plicatilis TaxID=10195 RepID=A0A3M7RHI2_BRAPC|nr:cold shock domain-containing E1-like [Brachionus plicatilis]
MLKENYGFIEVNIFDDTYKQSKAPKDIFFHYSSLMENPNELSVGDMLEFTVNRKNKQKFAAENVAKMAEKSFRPSKK